MKRLLTGLLLLVLVAPLFAQDAALTDAELELVEYVSNATTNTLALSSYTASGTMSITQHIEPESATPGIAEVNQEVEQTINGQMLMSEDGEISANMVIEQNIVMTLTGQPETNITQTIEIVVFDGNLYLRFSNLSPLLENLFPQDWVNLNENPNAFPGSEVIVADQYVQAIQASLALPLSEELINSIEELAEETMDGQTMRVFQMDINPVALFASEEMGTAMGMFNMQAMGVTTEEAMIAFGEKMQMQLLLYVGVEDELVHYQETYITVDELDMSGMMNQTTPVYLSQEITTAITYSDFNAPVTIEAPIQE